MSSHDPVKHPSHYTSQVPGVECIDVTSHFNFNRGNAIKYIWRAGAKGDAVQDLEKAKQYLDFEIQRIKDARERDTLPEMGERHDAGLHDDAEPGQ